MRLPTALGEHLGQSPLLGCPILDEGCADTISSTTCHGTARPLLISVDVLLI